MARTNNFLIFISLLSPISEHELHFLGKTGVVVDPDVVHPSEANLAVVAAVREIVPDKEDLVLDISHFRGIAHDRGVLVILLRGYVERSRPADKDRIVLEYLADLGKHLPAADLVRIEDEFVRLVSLGAEEGESDHSV